MNPLALAAQAGVGIDVIESEDARRNGLRLFIQRDIIDPDQRARRQRGR
ncbi:MAG: hypothetical protein Fur0014_00170 [Rubrivivax sp.]